MMTRHFYSTSRSLRSLLCRIAIATIVAALPAHAEEGGFDCVVDPAQTLKVASPERGLLSEVLVKRGDRIEKGQVIARLESSIEARTVELNALRARDDSSMRAANVRVELAKKNLNRALLLQESKIGSDQSLDQLRAADTIAQREQEEIAMRLRLAKLEHKRSEAILERRTVRSPIAGVVLERKVSTGEFVSDNIEILTLVQLDPLHVETFVPQGLYEQIQVGQRARVTLDGRDEEIEAVVTVLDPVFDAASRTVGVRLEFPNPDQALPGGMRCRVFFDDPGSGTRTTP